MQNKVFITLVRFCEDFRIKPHVPLFDLTPPINLSLNLAVLLPRWNNINVSYNYSYFEV